MKPHIVVLAIFVTAGLAGCAVPPAIQATDGEVALPTVPAHGVQIYECRAGANGTPAWTFVAPEAELFDGRGQHIGSHGAGPAWTHDDGSGFAGTVKARVDAPSAVAIPWLLLTARPQGANGAFSKVSSVQRINTVGGLAPADGCGTATLGRRARVAYRADYVLFVPRR